MMVIGLCSGKEIMVRDQSYYITVGDTLKQVFISESGLRRYTVAESCIEFYDEVHSTDYMSKIDTAIEVTKENLEAPKKDMSYV